MSGSISASRDYDRCMGARRPDDRGWLDYVSPAVAQGDVVRVVDGEDVPASGPRISKVEIFEDAVRVSWCDPESPLSDEPVETGERGHPHWRVADSGGERFTNTEGGSTGEMIDGRWVEHGHCIAATRAPHALTEVRLTDGTRTMGLRFLESHPSLGRRPARCSSYDSRVTGPGTDWGLTVPAPPMLELGHPEPLDDPPASV
jgi:hypothetical protein